MAVRKTGGHAVTSVLSGSDHTQASPASGAMNFQGTPGPAGYNGARSGGGGFRMSGGGKKSSVPSNGGQTLRSLKLR